MHRPVVLMTAALMVGGLVACADDDKSSSTAQDQTTVAVEDETMTSTTEGQAAVANTHTAQAGEPALISVPGYAYEDLTGNDLALYQQDVVAASVVANEEMRQAHPELGDLYLGSSGHKVVADGSEVALFAMGGINQAYLDAGVLTENDLLEEMAADEADLGATVSTMTIAGENVVHAENFGLYAYFWVHDGAKTALFGSDEGAVLDFVEAYLEVANK